MSEVFHRAARDGYLHLLRQATKRDCNGRDEDGMTPTLFAAYCGHLDALRLVIGRGGNPDLCDYFGRTALHHAAANGHMNCVSFLVSFGVNLWALDNEFHSALDTAALKTRGEIVRHLDGALAKQLQLNQKFVAKMRERAMLDAQKRNKRYEKMVEKARQNANESGNKFHSKHRVSATISAPMSYSSHFANSLSRTKFSIGGVARKITKHKTSNCATGNDELCISETDTSGTRTIRSFRGFKGDSNVVYMGQCDAVSIDGLSMQFDSVSRAMSEPDLFYSGADSGIESCDSTNVQPAGLFMRPGFGSVSFLHHQRTRGSTSSQTSSVFDDNGLTHEDDKSCSRATSYSDSIGSVGSLADRAAKDYNSAKSHVSNNNNNNSLRQFLALNGLAAFTNVFTREQIDMQAVLLLTDADLCELGLAMGPRRKLLAAIARQKVAVQSPTIIEQSWL